MPGALVWLWAEAVHGTVLRLRGDLRAQGSPGGVLACRRCGGTLVVESGALSASCRYCGTDSLVTDLPPIAASVAARDAALTTLDDATRALRRRRVEIGAGVVGFGVGVVTLAVLALLAFPIALT